jgi:hypothetical protein
MAAEMVRIRASLPRTLVEEIDWLVGRKGRSAFVAEAAEQELRRRRLLAAFDRAAGSRKDVDSPGWETSETAEAWVRDLRRAGTRDEWADAERERSRRAPCSRRAF